MKKFIFSILCVSVFFIGLGGLINQVGAKFKSDERALEVIRQARIAIGGDAAIKSVRSLTIVGSTAQSFTIDGATRTEQGNLEINLRLPNQFGKVLNFGRENDGAAGEKVVQKGFQVILLNKDGESVNSNQPDTDGAKKRFVITKKVTAKTRNCSKKEGAQTIIKSSSTKICNFPARAVFVKTSFSARHSRCFYPRPKVQTRVTHMRAKTRLTEIRATLFWRKPAANPSNFISINLHICRV